MLVDLEVMQATHSLNKPCKSQKK